MSRISSALIEGIQIANTQYEKWTHGWWITDSGVERYAVSVIVGTLINRLPANLRVVSELSFGHIQEWSARTRPVGRPRRHMNTGNRADIVILCASGLPVCVVEIKRCWIPEPCFQDLERMRNLVLECRPQNGGSLLRGILAFMIIGTGSNRTEAAFQFMENRREIRRTIENYFRPLELGMRFHCTPLRHYPYRYRRTFETDHWVHAGFCVELYVR